MIRFNSQKQMTLDGFDTPFQTLLDENNRWVKLSKCIPWDAFAASYYQSLSSNKGRPAKNARLVIGAVILKHKLCLSDEETVGQIQENPYLQFFVGFSEFQTKQPFAPSLFVEIRRRMGEDVFKQFEKAIVNQIENKKSSKSKKDNQKNDPPSASPVVCDEDAEGNNEDKKSGKLIIDATVAEQAIRFPTDFGLLNESREISEKIIDELYIQSDLNKKPRTYRQKARKAYLAIVKQRRPGVKVRRRGIKQQLQYLRRNLKHIDEMLSSSGQTRIGLPHKILRQYWIIQQVFMQQEQMHKTKTKRCDDRIVSISQPQVRPIVRGKPKKSVEFGAKLGVSLSDTGLASVDHISWDAYHEGTDLKIHVENYKLSYGHYPKVVLADTIYGTRVNRKYLKGLGIRYAGKPLGRPKKVTPENKRELQEEKARRREEYRQRIPIEGKFGQGKGGYRLNYIRAKTASTSESWIRSIFMVMNLMVLMKVFLFSLTKWSFVMLKTNITIFKHHFLVDKCIQQDIRRFSNKVLLTF